MNNKNTNINKTAIKRALYFRQGQKDRNSGLPCSSANGSYLDGWYAPEQLVPPSLTEQEMIEANI